MIDLIFCAGAGRRFAAIAVSLGWLYGYGTESQPTQSPVSFIDLEKWWQPDLKRHLAAAKLHRPKYAVIPDIVDVRELRRTLKQAAVFSRWAEKVIIVPKAGDIISLIPDDEQIVLGYSVPTSHGGTELWAGEFAGRDVHLLGGGPDAQIRTALQLAGSRVISADGNYAAKVARFGKSCQIGPGGKLRWIRADSLGASVAHDVPYVAFERSLINIKQAWEWMYP